MTILNPIVSSTALALIGDVGAGEVIVILAAILVLFGGKSLPGMARTLGKITRDLQRASQDFKDQLLSADQPAPPPPVAGNNNPLFLQEGRKETKVNGAAESSPSITPPESKESAPHDPAGK